MSARTTTPAKAGAGGWARRYRLAQGACARCDHPSSIGGEAHDASRTCQSGKRSHCTCVGCF